MHVKRVDSQESLSGFVLRSIGMIAVEEKNSMIEVRNIYAPILEKDLKKIFNTKISKYMFSKITRTSFTINRFYAIELYFILKELKETGERVFTSVSTCNKIIDGLLENTWLRGVVKYLGSIENPVPSADIDPMLDYSALSEFKVKPLPHQAQFFERYDYFTRAFDLNGYYLAAGPGSGKTIAALMLYRMLKRRRNYEKLIVLSPLNAVDDAWKEDPEESMKRPMRRWTKASGKPLDTQAELLVYHHDATDKLMEDLEKLKRYNCMVVIDEGHKFNNTKSARTERLINAVNYLQCKDVLWLSGTPIKAVGTEAIPFMCTVIPEFGTPYNSNGRLTIPERFKKLFGASSNALGYLLANRLGLTTYKVERNLYRNEEPIRETIKVAIPNGERFTLKAIGAEMLKFIEERYKYYKSIEKEYTTEYFNALEYYENAVGNQDEKEYAQYLRDVKLIRKTVAYGQIADVLERANKFEKHVIEPVLPKEMVKTFRHVKSAYKYVDLKIRGEALGRILGKRRAECQVELVKYLPLKDIVDQARKKTILFTSYVEVVDQMMDIFERQDYKPIAVYGKTNNQLESIIERFDKDESINPLVATLQSLSTAVRLTMASTVVFTNEPFREHERQQAEARVDRIGQDGLVTLISCELDTGTEPNVNTRSKDIMQWSKEQIDMLMGKFFGKIETGDIAVSTESGGYVNLLTDIDELSNYDLIDIDEIKMAA